MPADVERLDVGNCRLLTFKAVASSHNLYASTDFKDIARSSATFERFLPHVARRA